MSYLVICSICSWNERNLVKAEYWHLIYVNFLFCKDEKGLNKTKIRAFFESHLKSEAAWTLNMCKMKQKSWIALYNLWKNRSGHQRCSVEKGVLRNFAKFTGKHLCQSLFLRKLQASGLGQVSRRILIPFL